MTTPVDIAPAVVGRELPAPQESDWPLDDLVLRGLTWSRPETSQVAPPIIGLHGWLDNAATFSRIAPALGWSRPFYGIDFAGHGHSDHRGAGQSYPLLDYVKDIAGLVERHFQQPVVIVGHSLGGIVGSLYAATFPERVDRLVMIDSLGPLTQSPESGPEQLRKGIRKHLRGSGAAMTYGSVEDAARIRAGGLSPLSPEAAALLVPRNLRPVEGGYQWRTDARLRYPSLSRLDEAQVAGFLQAIEAPTLFVRASDGLLGGRESWRKRIELIPHLQEAVVPGSHHCHLDGEVQPVIDAISAFLTS
ncbi:alpha/beta hydrolase [Marinobacter halodurans]|uniref:Alpha/beta hydrolase n=1 Tax=Marinobacter halodurans TaxID=2528979 RepID=A0ABY1ZN85_9GAMM|nr:alpha/beta hydrolase [Marinobacter halodurans]TBW54735.1 alpha/beta hydrolase [Marinobacter halodurans]